jgi:hypothetical protein
MMPQQQDESKREQPMSGLPKISRQILEKRGKFATLLTGSNNNNHKFSSYAPAIALVSWEALTFFISQIARAASKLTMSLL